MEEINMMLETLSKAPDSQIDKQITDQFKTLIGKSKDEIKPILLKCIEESQIYALASGFAIISMKLLYECMLDGDEKDYKVGIVSQSLN